MGQVLYNRRVVVGGGRAAGAEPAFEPALFVWEMCRLGSGNRESAT